VHDPIASTDGQPGAPAATGSTGSDAVDDAARELQVRVSSAVSSFLGLSVTLLGGPATLILTTADDIPGGAARTSLSFSVLLTGGRSARFTLYAQQPGALVDLHADLTFLGQNPQDRSDDQSRAPKDVRLDEDLPRPSTVPGLVGLQEQSTVHRAEGMLIESGTEPDDALHAYARQLLADRTPR
jgi:hypothetical protein